MTDRSFHHTERDERILTLEKRLAETEAQLREVRVRLADYHAAARPMRKGDPQGLTAQGRRRER